MERPSYIRNRSYNKLFCIGENKTGTSTMEYLLREYGFNLPEQRDQELSISEKTYAHDYSRFRIFVEQYDAFQDQPFSQSLTFVAADALFPDSKFILTVRESNAWFDSLLRFHSRLFGFSPDQKLTEKDIIEKFDYLHPGYLHKVISMQLTFFKGDQKVIDWSKLYNREHYIERYEERNELIKRYFAQTSNRLLVIDVTKEPDTSKICDFLNLPPSLIRPMPHLNSSR